MDNFFEKFTLYDLLGYTIPGTILLVVMAKDVLIKAYELELLENFMIYICLTALVLGYCIGVAVAGVVRAFETVILKSKFCNYEFEKIGYEAIKRALYNAGVINENTEVNSEEDVQKHLGYMYGEIQSKAKYKRLHNYAAMELFCENMSFVCGLSTVIISIRDNASCWIVVCGVLLVCLFGFQANTFNERKDFYAVAWFVKSHK